MKKDSSLSIGAFRLDLAIAPDDRFLGIGAVLHGRTPLRSAAFPWTFFADASPFEFRSFRLLGIDRRADGGATIRFESTGEWSPRSDLADAMGEARTCTRRAKAPIARFAWTFRPIRETLCGNVWDGLAMRLRVHSPDAPLHDVLEDATWEIGGSATGATLIQQDVSTIDLEQRVSRRSAFSTVEKFFLEGWGGSFPMDMLPRAAGSAILDFQAKGDTALALFAERPGLTRARLEKFADEDVVHYSDRPFIARAANAVFPERKLLVHQAEKPHRRHEIRNLWLDAFTEVRRRILRPFGFTPEIPLPIVHTLLWDEELKRRGPGWTRDLAAVLPEYARLGYREVFTHGVWDSVTSDPAPKRPGNICCPYSYRFADAFGGAPEMRGLNAAAHDAGLRLFQWFSFQLSRDSPVWTEHPEWRCRRPDGNPWNASYDELWSGKMNGPYGDWIESQIHAVQDDTGISGAFWDSYQNLGLTCIDWPGDDRAPQAERIWRLQAALQRRGFRQRCEIVTPFGVSQVAMFGFRKQSFRRRLWDDLVRTDAAFALLDTAPAFFDSDTAYSPERVSPERYFWLLAHRAVPPMGGHPWKDSGYFVPGGDLAEDYGRANRLYNAALPRMHRLRLVAGGACTLWLDAKDRPAAVWCFRPCRLPCTGSFTDLETGAPAPARLVPGHVYVR